MSATRRALCATAGVVLAITLEAGVAHADGPLLGGGAQVVDEATEAVTGLADGDAGVGAAEAAEAVLDEVPEPVSEVVEHAAGLDPSLDEPPLLEGVTDAATQAVGDAPDLATDATDAVEPLLAPVLTEAPGVADDSLEAVAGATGDVADLLNLDESPLERTVDPIVETAATALEDAAEVLVDVTETIDHVVEPVVEDVAPLVGQVVAPILETLPPEAADVVDPVVELVPQPSEPAVDPARVVPDAFSRDQTDAFIEVAANDPEVPADAYLTDASHSSFADPVTRSGSVSPARAPPPSLALPPIGSSGLPWVPPPDRAAPAAGEGWTAPVPPSPGAAPPSAASPAGSMAAPDRTQRMLVPRGRTHPAGSGPRAPPDSSGSSAGGPSGPMEAHVTSEGGSAGALAWWYSRLAACRPQGWEGTPAVPPG